MGGVDDALRATPSGAGRLFVVATPIGNLADLTERARDVLAAADRILAEDTRRARVLLSRAGVSARPVSLHAGNEASRASRVRAWLAAGDDVALVSDAGTPLLSDPGDRVVRAAIADGRSVVPIPGASAILAALVVSGLPAAPFVFLGFPPRSGRDRARVLDRVEAARETAVLFESPRRLQALLEDLEVRFGETDPERRVAVCREMTKVHEEVVRGSAADCARRFRRRPPRGEATVVVEGRSEPAASGRQVDGEARAALDAGLAPTAAAREVARRTGVSRSAAYDAVLRRKRGGDPERGRLA